MKSKITKIQNLFMKGIAIIISTMMSITPLAYATTNLNDNGEFDVSIIDQILYGKVGATAKEIEKYFAEGHTTLYISSEIQLRALAKYVNNAHNGQDNILDNNLTCNGDHSCSGKEIILTKNIELSSEEWNPIGHVLSTDERAIELQTLNPSSDNTSSDPVNGSSETITNENDEGDNTEIETYTAVDEGNEVEAISAHTAGDELIARELYNRSEEIITSAIPFNGIFNGNGHTISGLRFFKANKTNTELNYVGLFGVTGTNAVIKNLSTDNFNIDIPFDEEDLCAKHSLQNNEDEYMTTQYGHAGNIVGYNQGKILNCTNNSEIKGASFVGGIAGYSTGNIENTVNAGKVSGYENVGGIVGKSIKNVIKKSANVAKITGEKGVGGIAGTTNSMTTLENCTNREVIEGKTEVGGIIGNAVNSKKISSVNNYAAISGTKYIGGIVGLAETSKISNALNNGEKTKSITSTENYVGGIAGKIYKSEVNRSINRMQIKGYQGVGGIIGWAQESDIYHVYTYDPIDTQSSIAGADVVGLGYIGGLVGCMWSSSLRKSGTTAEVLGVYNYIGGAVGYIYNGTKYNDSNSGISMIGVMGTARLDVDHWTFSSETSGIYQNNENPVIKQFNASVTPYGVASIVGGINATKSNETVITNNYVFGNVIGANGTGTAVGYVSGEAQAVVKINGTIKDAKYESIISKVNTTSDVRQFGIALKNTKEKVQNEDRYVIKTAATTNITKTNKSTGSVTKYYTDDSHGANYNVKKLGYYLYRTGLICGYCAPVLNASITNNFYGPSNAENSYEDKLFKESGNTINNVHNGVYGAEYVKGGSNNYEFKEDKKTEADRTKNSIEMPIVNGSNQLETPVIGNNIELSSMGNNQVQNITGNAITTNSQNIRYTINYKLYKNDNEINSEEYLKGGDKLKVVATIDAPLVWTRDPLQGFTLENAPTLSLKKDTTVVVESIKPISISSVTENSTETSFTYEYTVPEDANNTVNKISLNKVVDLLVAGTDINITAASFGEASFENVYLDNTAPDITTELYVDHPLETKRYTAGKEVLIKVTTKERIYGNYILPEVRVRFSKSGLGKYIYARDAKAGFAKIKSSNLNIDGTTEWIYSYIIQEGDEGYAIAEFKSGTIMDRAGNSTYLQDKYSTTEPEEYKATNKFGKEFLIKSVEIYKDAACKNEINRSQYQTGDLYIKVELDDALYTNISQPIVKTTAPKLYLNKDIPTEVVSVTSGKTIVYHFDMSNVSNLTIINYITLKNETDPIGNATHSLFYGKSSIEKGEGFDKGSIYTYQNDIKNIILDPNNIYNDDNSKEIYADTTLPTVNIIAYKVNSAPSILPENITENDNVQPVQGDLIENNSTNAGIIRYRFIFSESVKGFTEDDITVNFGTKKGLYKIANSNDTMYDLYVETNTAKDEVKDLKIILEQDAVQDLVYKGNVRREHTITIDKKSPKLESYTLREEEGKIIVEATYDEAISNEGTSTLNVKVGGVTGKGNVTSEIVEQENSVPAKVVRYTYTISPEDGGKVEITLNGKVIDLAGNNSEELNENIDNDINLERASIKSSNKEYIFYKGKGNSKEPIKIYAGNNYFKKGESITVKEIITEIVEDEEQVTENVYEYDLEDNIQCKQMLGMLFVNEEVKFYDRLSGIDIRAANIYFDTVAPVVTTKVEANNPSEGAYRIGDELTITATSSEKVTENVRPEIEVKFDNTLGKFNNGIAQYVETKENENGTTSWIYRYVISEGDEGSIDLSYKAGKVTDIAGNSTTLTSLNDNDNDNIFTLNDIDVDATLPRVVITPKDVNNSVTNKDEITYVFTWSEEVEGFDPGDITVNNGNKGTFEQDPTNKKVYTMKVTTNVETGNTGDIQVIVEKDAVQDKAGYGNVRTESVIRVDKQAPILVSLEAFGNSDIKVDPQVDTVKQYYKVEDGKKITVVATFNENIENSTVPTLNLEFSESGNAKGNVSNGVIEGNKITYTYTITDGDNGTLSVKGFTGKVSDAAGNETVVTKRKLDGDTIIADTVNPTLMALTAIAPEFEYDELVNGETEDSVRYGVQSKTRDKNTITIIATYSENIYNLSSNTINNITSSNAPTLKLRFGTSTERTATFQKIEGDKIYYTYNIASGDNGDLTITKLSGTVSDLAGNTLTTSTSLPTLTKYEAEVKDENKVNVIVADTTKPSYTITASAVDKDDKLNDITGNGSYYRKGSIITITATTNELVYKNNNKVLTQFTNENAPVLNVKFGDLAGKGQVKCTDVQYSGNKTIFTYEYIVADGDNGTLSASIVENTGYDISLNGNNGKTQTVSNIIADTVNPVTNWQSWVDSEGYGIEDKLNGTWVVTFSETMYVYNDNTHKVGSVLSNSNKSSAPILLVSNDNKTPLETTISKIETINGKTVITYTYSPYARNIGAYGMKFASVSDKAGNLFNYRDQVPPVLNELKVISPETGTYKAGQEIIIEAVFSEKVAGTAPVLKIKFGDNGTERIANRKHTEDNVITYTYTIQNGDNGKLELVSYTGDNLLDTVGNKWVVPENITLSGNEITADTIAPEASITVYDRKLDLNGDNKVNKDDIEALQNYVSDQTLLESVVRNIETYGDLNNDGKITVVDVTMLQNIINNAVNYDIRKNGNSVIYEIIWSEPVYGFEIDDIEVVNGSKGIFTGKDGDTIYTLEVDTTNEGRQIVKVPANVCTDIAGNENSERATYNNVVIDYTKPIVRAKINGGKYVIDEDSNKSTLKEIIVVNEEISKFEYTWSDEDTIPEDGWTTYPNVDNITVNSDIPLTTKVDREGTYYLYMKVTDKAGNVFKGRTNGFVVSNDTITLTPNTTESTNQDITVTVSYGTQTTGLTQERRAGIQGMSQSADPTKVILKENGVVYAEAKDIAGNKVYETLEINNIDKTAPTAEITYNTNEDGSVTATITLSDGRITNNEGKTTYTFNENGEFTFEYEDSLGNKGTATAKVTTIDKHEDPQPEPQPEPQPTDEDNTAPEITFNYSTTSATVGTKIGSAITTNEDAKISYKWNNGQWKTSSDYIRSYNITYTPATAGTYTLYAKAEDKAGNVTDEKTLVFNIVNSQEDVKEPEIEFNDLTVIQKNGVKYVKVSPTYTVEELNAKINKEKLLGVTPTFAKLTSAGKLRTGSEIKLNNTTKYIVIVNGDVNCDGKVDFINDIIMINNYRIGKINNLSEIQILAGDINNSGTIEFISDIISMNNYRLGNINVL